MKSSYEFIYAAFLELLVKSGTISDWEYETDLFWFEGIKRGTNNYTPDFKIFNTDGSVEYHEVKGYMDAKSKTKLKRMKKYHPDVKIVVVDGSFFRKHKRVLMSYESALRKYGEK